MFTQLLTSLQTTPTHLSLVRTGSPFLSSSSTVVCYVIFGLHTLRKRVCSITKDQDLFSKGGSRSAVQSSSTAHSLECSLPTPTFHEHDGASERSQWTPESMSSFWVSLYHIFTVWGSRARSLFTNSLRFLIHCTFKLMCNFSGSSCSILSPFPVFLN